MVPIRAAQQRTLLAALAIRAGSTVSVEELATDVWGDPLPGKWRDMLPPLMRRLRVALGAEQALITTCYPGYRLNVSPEDVDVLAFEALCKDGHAAMQSQDWRRAVETLAQAEKLWRGEPFADVPSPMLRDRHLDSYALERQLASAQEARIEASVRISARSARAALPELTALARRNPANEHTCWLLMLALYRAGTVEEALAAYRETRRHITDALGVEPGIKLKTLNQLILTGDRALLREPFDSPAPV